MSRARSGGIEARAVQWERRGGYTPCFRNRFLLADLEGRFLAVRTGVSGLMLPEPVPEAWRAPAPALPLNRPGFFPRRTCRGHVSARPPHPPLTHSPWLGWVLPP